MVEVEERIMGNGGSRGEKSGCGCMHECQDETPGMSPEATCLFSSLWLLTYSKTETTNPPRLVSSNSQTPPPPPPACLPEIMRWWRTLKRACLDFLSLRRRIKPAASPSSSGTGGGGGGGRCVAAGLLKLQDEVEVCGYKDVEVMWSMLLYSSSSRSSPQQQQEEEDPLPNPTKPKKVQRPAWRALSRQQKFSPAAAASSLSSCFVFGFNSSY